MMKIYKIYLLIRALWSSRLRFRGREVPGKVEAQGRCSNKRTGQLLPVMFATSTCRELFDKCKPYLANHKVDLSDPYRILEKATENRQIQEHVKTTSGGSSGRARRHRLASPKETQEPKLQLKRQWRRVRRRNEGATSSEWDECR